MIHISQGETDIFALAVLWKHPESLPQAQQSPEHWIAIMVTDLTMFLYPRERFLKVVSSVVFDEAKRSEALLHMEQFFNEKGMPCTFAAWEPKYYFTSQVPNGGAQ
jgi:hypothetical protein